MPIAASAKSALGMHGMPQIANMTGWKKYWTHAVAWAYNVRDAPTPACVLGALFRDNPVTKNNSNI